MIELITGPMSCGKTNELIRRINLAAVNERVELFKPRIDDRYKDEKVVSHNGIECACKLIDCSKEILPYASKVDTIGIEEIQFLDDGIIDFCIRYSLLGKRVIASGLNLDFRAKPFSFKDSTKTIAELMPYSDHTNLFAKCTYSVNKGMCAEPAMYSQKFQGNGSLASFDGDTIEVGKVKLTMNEVDREQKKAYYEPRCLNHYMLERNLHDLENALR